MSVWKTVTVIGASVVVGIASASVTTAKLDELAKGKLSKAFQDETVVAAIKQQNEQHKSLSQPEIDKLDKQWRAEAKSGSGPLIERVLSNALSGKLKSFKDSGQGLYTEIFVMDNRGLNVGQSDVTSDYWQGDEAKWKKTYLAGAGAVFIDEVEFDESTQTYQSQISLSVVDPATNEVIGAVTVGVNVEALE